MNKPETMRINDIRYVREDYVSQKADDFDGLALCIVRTYSAGVFLGYVKEKKSELNGVNIRLLKTQRLWAWSGACSISQLAVDGTVNAQGCKFSVVVEEQEIFGVIEIIPVSEKAEESLRGVEIWKK